MYKVVISTALAVLIVAIFGYFFFIFSETNKFFLVFNQKCLQQKNSDNNDISKKSDNINIQALHVFYHKDNNSNNNRSSSNLKQNNNQQCENNPEYQYLNLPMHEHTVQALTNKTYRKSTLYIPRMSTFERPFIYHIKGPKKGQEFIICTTPKSGNTRLKMLLQKILKQKYNFGDIYKYDQYNPLEWKTGNQLKKLLNNKNIYRFMFVRNPYVRTISMYQDKIAGKGDSKLPEKIKLFSNLKIGLKKNITFDQFVEILYRRTYGDKVQKSPPLDRHFVPQSTACGIDFGLTYNYILKQEKINDWYDCFIDAINARNVVMHGWPNETNCYFSSPKNPCDGPMMVNGSLREFHDAKSIKHFTGSSALVDQYYENKTVVKMVSEIFRQDIINFNYEFL